RLQLGGSVSGVKVGAKAPTIHGGREASPRQLYLVDGVVVEDLSFLDEAQIASLDVLSSTDATAIYGSRASQGVIMVTTKNGANIPPDKVSEGFAEIPLLPKGQTPSRLRSNFDDLAYWQPALRTDQSGRARFEVQFPDDITRWEQFGLAYDAKSRRMATTQIGTPSFQSFMAELSMPRFLVAGDQSTVFGKVRNLTTDTLPAELSFQNGDSRYSTKSLQLGPNALDTLAITASEKHDSLALSFRLYLPTQNYFDGEDRSIPVYPKGDRVSEGYFLLLAADSNVTVSLPPGEVTLKAVSSPLELFQEELEHIGRYRYFCNEQSASKLKALLAKQRISEAIGEEFGQQREVRKLISQLLKGRNQDQLWGWWSQNPTSYWISNHVIAALLSAKALDYKVDLNLSPLALSLTYQLTAPPFSASRQIGILQSLYRLGHPLDFETYLDSLDADTSLSLSDHFRVQRLRQQLKLPYQLDTLRKYQQESVYQELFWASDGHRLQHGSIEATLLAYQLLKEDGNSSEDLLRIQAWLLRQKGPKGWENTYASIRVVETLLPDLLEGEALPSPSKLLIQAERYRDSLTHFPQAISWENTLEITMQQRGHLPVYVALIQERYELDPVADSTHFRLKSWLNDEIAPDTSLRVGTPCSFNVEIFSAKSAEYVLVEIPIPAGCSYLSSKQSNNPYEVYREEQKDRVVICCRRLPIGKHRFSVSLQPRFPGTYVLNPARVEEMYFPTIFGRTAPKSLKIYSP
ncbi:MAG: alpha-2-macroglobulin family protein, partial [Bacteroidota bacterium]